MTYRKGYFYLGMYLIGLPLIALTATFNRLLMMFYVVILYFISFAGLVFKD